MRPGEVELWTDGSCAGPTGEPGGWAFILRYCDREGTIHEKVGSGGDGSTTSQRMELTAFIEGMARLTRTDLALTVYTDSEYLRRGATEWLPGWERNGWKRGKERRATVKNVTLWKRISEVLCYYEVTFVHVDAHTGVDLNERCDQMAKAAWPPVRLPVDEELDRSLDWALATDA